MVRREEQRKRNLFIKHLSITSDMVMRSTDKNGLIDEGLNRCNGFGKITRTLETPDPEVRPVSSRSKRDEVLRTGR